jgi:TRAP-type C4-dicarboxylate transport system substrate-binding protein
MRLNGELEEKLQQRGMKVIRVDAATFRRRIPPACYARWRERCGTSAWKRLEEAIGKLD